MKLYHILLLALVAIMMPSCSNEMQIEPAGKQDEVAIQLNMTVPGVGSDAKAITGIEESEITYADVLAFTSDGTNMRFAYKATNIRIGSPAGDVLTITATVKGLTSAQQFLVLANAQDELNTITIAPGETLTSVVTKLVCAAGNGEFPARINGTGTYKPIPMYAKTTTQVVTESTGTIENFPMLRMVARVNVTMKDTITNFQLVEAALYNFKKAGYVAYDFSNFVTDKVTTPAVPTAGQHSGNPILEPTVFHQADAAGKILNSIFTYESPAFTDTQRLTGTALVIGGYYGGNTSKKVYYRIDLKAVGDATANLSSPILRNHSYNVEVQKVSGPGADTGIDAYKGKVEIGVHIEAAPWDIVNADGDIHGRTLNVSALEKVLIDANIERVYFNSNQPTVTLDAAGLNSSGIVLPVTDFLTAPATTNFHYTYNPTTKIGKGYIDLIAASGAIPDTYRIYVNAGGLKREVKVTVAAASECTMYVGMFGGQLKKTAGRWKFERPLYIQCADESPSVITWGPATPTTGANRLWDGRDNTFKLSIHSSTFPAAELCANKNSGTINAVTDANYIWYLPAQNQLMAVWVSANTFGSAFSSSSYYWSSTEHSSILTHAWAIDLSNGDMSCYPKGNSYSYSISYRVRCVREN